MEANIKHLVLTRFNVASPGREQAIRLRPGWLEERLVLFRDYCLPSVASQTRDDFEWIVFFDEKTPDEYREKIKALQATYPFRSEYTRLFDMRTIAPSLLGGTNDLDWLLTTRLDSDDILAANFVERLRDIVRHPKPTVVNFRNGAILSVTGGLPRLYRIEDDSNPFASLIEQAGGNVRTIWGEKHVDIEHLGSVHQEDGEPAWLQVVHGGNVSNRIKGLRIPLQSLSSTFPYLRSISANQPSRTFEIEIENRVVKPFRAVREILRGIAKYIYYKIAR